ncbi:MAG TPA: ornithine carbamoyltransferase, partial [Pirellulales bacterium]
DSASMRHLLRVTDLTTVEIERIFAITADLKSKFAQGIREALLPGRVIGMLFEKPSLRTRVSFEAGMTQLGGGSLFLGNDVGFFGSRESLPDFVRVLSQYVDGVVIRSNRHQTVVDFAKHSSRPVINGLTDYSHPCQALADLYTLRELVGRLHGLTLAYVGDANNVARSLVEACGRLGMRIVLVTPKAYQFSGAELDRFRQEIPGLELSISEDPAAIRGAAAVYTDVWASMGQEAESAKRRADFTAYQVNAALMKHAPNAYFMHCLPAHRGDEVTDDVIDGPNSIVIPQAGNRLHVQKGILAWLLSR